MTRPRSLISIGLFLAVLVATSAITRLCAAAQSEETPTTSVAPEARATLFARTSTGVALVAKTSTEAEVASHIFTRRDTEAEVASPTFTRTSTEPTLEYVRAPEPAEDTHAVERALFLLPRAALHTLAILPRLAVAAVDAVQLPATIEGLFWDDSRQFGILPAVGVEAPFGVRAGAQLIHRSLFGHGERLDALGQWGGWLNQRYALSLTSGLRLQPVLLRAFGRYEAVPRVLYYGRLGELGQRTASSRRSWEAEVVSELDLEPWTVGLYGNWTLDHFGEPNRSDDPFTADVFAVDPRTYATGGIETLGLSLEVELDLQTTSSRFNPPSIPSEGFRAAGRVGGHFVTHPDGFRYQRYAAHLEQRFDLFRGDRILVLAARAEGVVGTSQIPIFELPTLGGIQRLRGYVRGRFRARHLLYAVAEYHFPVEAWIDGFLFAELGAPFDHVADLSARFPRSSFGFGLALFAWNEVLGRGHIGVSADGTVNVGFGIPTDFALGHRENWQ